MSHSRRSRNMDYARIAKAGFVGGLALFVIGVVGELAGHAVLASMPPTAEQGLFAMEVLGVLVGFFVPVVFGAVLPLTE
jgi:hypothetical protein